MITDKKLNDLDNIPVSRTAINNIKIDIPVVVI